MATVPKLFNGLATGLTQGEYRLYSVTLGLLQDWTTVSLTVFDVGVYQAQIPLPAGFVQGYIVSRAFGDPTTQSFPEEIGTGVFVPTLPSLPVLTGTNNVGVALARQRRAFIYQYGVNVTVGGVPYRMQTEPVTGPDTLLPYGITNAAAAGLRMFTAAPADFAVPPLPGSAITWEGTSYTVLLSSYQEKCAVPNRICIRAYRTPQPTTATVETTAEAVAEGKPANAGLRKAYLPVKPPF